MIDKIHIEALKSIKNLTVRCANMNLLVGTNSSGKSTFLQALLIGVQGNLNGRLVSIGEFREVRNYSLPGKAIRVEIWEKGKKEPAWIEVREDREKETYQVHMNDDEEFLYDNEIDDGDQSFFPAENIDFHYLSCHRVGVKDIYDKNMLEDNDFGIDGEYALAFLLKNASVPVCDTLAVQNDNITSSLLDQVNYWLEYITGTTLAVSDIKKTNYMQVKYNNNPANSSSEALYCRPVNVGSGISYLISVIISCLGSEDDSVIIIENPEIHLHPKAQSRLCEFLCFVSRANRQLFIETHSDHIFNGLRVEIANKKLSQEDVAIDFFALNEQYETLCNPVLIKEYGRIVGTNEEMDLNDLFDQFEIDLDKMLGL